MSQRHLKETIDRVCGCLGYGANKTAPELLLETVGVETTFGMYEDPTKYAGMGLTQFDKMPFYDLKSRVNGEEKQRVLGCFGIDLDLVHWEDLRYNPLLALIFTRIAYRKIPEEIPTTVKERAAYWKKYYNTKAGKGTVEKYVAVNARYWKLVEAEEIRYA